MMDLSVYLLDICLKFIYLFIEIPPPPPPPPPPNPLDYCECWKHFFFINDAFEKVCSICLSDSV